MYLPAYRYGGRASASPLPHPGVHRSPVPLPVHPRPPPGTSPSPVGASPFGVLAGPLGIPPPPCPPYASSEHPPYVVQLPHPMYFAGSAAYAGDSPTALPDLRRVPGESPGDMYMFSRPLPSPRGLHPVPSREAPPSTPPTSRRDPSPTRARRYFRDVPSPLLAAPGERSREYRAPYLPKMFSPPLAGPSVLPGTTPRIRTATGSPPRAGPSRWRSPPRSPPKPSLTFLGAHCASRTPRPPRRPSRHRRQELP